MVTYVSPKELPGLPPLTRAYLAEFSRLAQFFPEPPQLERDWSALADRNRASRADPARVAAILHSQNQQLGAPPESLANCSRLGESGALAVVTGQQVGYLGGPAYTLYKGLTAIRLAEVISQRSGRPCVPIFYLVSEDHDLEEIRHSHFLDQRHQLLTLSLDLGGPSRPANQVQLSEDSSEHHLLLRERLPATSHRDALLDRLADCYRPGESLPRAFARWMLYLLGDMGLVLLDPADPRLKQLALRVFQQEIEEDSPASRAVATATEELSRLGFPPQIRLQRDRLNLFLLEGGRHALHLRDGLVVAQGVGKRWRKDEFLAFALEHPERLSPNVVLRPLFQDTLVPTVAYVAGPAEIAYYAQLGPVYRTFGLSMPVIWPRTGFTLLTLPVARHLERLGMDPADLLRTGRIGRSLLAGDQELAEIRGQIAGMGEELSRAWGKLTEKALRIDGSLEGYLRKSLGQLLHILAEAEAKVARARRRKDEELREHLRMIENTLLPLGRPQERVLNPLSFLVRAGKELIQRLYGEVQLDSFDHTVLTA